MEWIANNIFSLITLGVLIASWLISYGTTRAEQKELCEKVEGLETDMKSTTKKIDDHIANSDVHVNNRLTLLFEEKFASLKTDNQRIRDDVSRVERKVDNIERKT